MCICFGCSSLNEEHSILKYPKNPVLRPISAGGVHIEVGVDFKLFDDPVTCFVYYFHQFGPTDSPPLYEICPSHYLACAHWFTHLSFQTTAIARGLMRDHFGRSTPFPSDGIADPPGLEISQHSCAFLSQWLSLRPPPLRSRAASQIGRLSHPRETHSKISLDSSFQ